MWADTQVPFNIKVNTVQTKIMTAVGVNVSNTFDTFRPQMSGLGTAVAEILLRGLDDPSVRAFEVRKTEKI